jgi:hypothetical protein
MDDHDGVIQRRGGWVVSRLSWVLMAAFIFAASIGFTGSGGHFSRHWHADGSTKIDSPAISRWYAADHLSITLSADNGANVLLPKEFAEAFEIEAVAPLPQSVAATEQGLLYTFAFAGTQGDRRIDFSLRAARPGLYRPQAAMEIGDQRFASQPILVLP